jgi:hypothetical protein
MKQLLIFLSAVLTAQAMDAQCIQWLPSTPAVVCDNTSNDTSLWNNSRLYDGLVKTQDLGEAEVRPRARAQNTCTKPYTVSAVLFLDLDQNGSAESIWRSNRPISAGYFPFDNKGNVAQSVLDSVPYNPAQTAPGRRSRLLPIARNVGNLVETELFVELYGAGGTDTVPLVLPYGIHRVEWTVRQGLSFDVTSQVLEVRDCLPPVVACKSLVGASIFPSGIIELWATDFLLSATDNYAPADLLVTGIRKAGTGNDFPSDANGDPIDEVEFTCNELGLQQVELWMKDPAGNASFCTAQLEVQDINGFCAGDSTFVDVCVVTACGGEPISNVVFQVAGSYPGNPPVFNTPITVDTLQTGCRNFFVGLGDTLIGNTCFTPTLDEDDLNGVTAYDLLLISRHILGLQSLGASYNIIAADANKSGSVTTFDMIEIHKLLLGLYPDGYPSNTSWRFIDAGFVFPNIDNPFQSTFPEASCVLNSIDDGDSTKIFEGVKVGDVNCSALPNANSVPVVFPNKTVLISGKQQLNPGEKTTVKLSLPVDEQMTGMQFALRFDPDALQINGSVGGGLPYVAQSAAVYNDRIRFANAYPDGFAAVAGDALVAVEVQAKQALNLNNVLWLDTTILNPEIYNGNLEQFTLVPTYVNNFKSEEAQTTDRSSEIMSALRIAPNPFGSSFEVFSEAPGRLRMWDAQGRLMAEMELVGGNNRLRVEAASWAPGVYGWQVVADGVSRSGKLAKY